MPHRSSLVGVLLFAALAPASSALAAAPTITSPTPNEVVQDSAPTVSGTATYNPDLPTQVSVHVQGTQFGDGGYGSDVDVQPDGTWTFTSGRLDPGDYQATACVGEECATPVPFKIARPTVISSIAPIQGAFSDLIRNRLKITVTCARPCDIQGTLDVSADDARRMTVGRTIGSFSKSEAPKGTNVLTVTPRGGLEMLSVWPMFTAPVGVTVNLEGEDATASGSLAWFRVPSDRGGRGHEFIRSITGPKQVSLSSASVEFKVRLKPIPTTRYISGGIDTPGNYFASTAKWFKNGHPTTGADFSAGGTFTLRVPIAHPLRGLAKARKLAPAVAELSVGILNKHAPHDHDEARLFIELVR
jgi:hypothetical protein